MVLRSFYTGVIAVCVLAIVFAAALPWAQEFVGEAGISQAEYGWRAGAGFLGLKAGPSTFALALSVALAALTVWFWLDDQITRLRIASLAMAAIAGLLCLMAALVMADAAKYLGGFAYEVDYIREGAYLTIVASAAIGITCIASLLTYNPAADRPLRSRRATAALFAGLPALTYLILTVWLELGLPSLRPAVPLVTYYAGYPDDLAHPLEPDFRHIVAPIALGCLAAAVAAVAAYRRPRFVALSSTGLVGFSYAGFLALEGWFNWWNNPCNCYEPAQFLRRLNVHTEEHGDAAGFLMAAEVLAMMAIIVVSSIWLGVASERLYCCFKRNSDTPPV